MFTNLKNDDNAVSVSVSFIITFSIVVFVSIAITGTFYQIEDKSKYITAREQMLTCGNDLSNKISEVDHIVKNTRDNGGTLKSINTSYDLPDKITNERYKIKILPSEEKLIFETLSSSHKMVVPYHTNTINLTQKIIYSDSEEHYLYYNKTTNEVVIH